MFTKETFSTVGRGVTFFHKSLNYASSHRDQQTIYREKLKTFVSILGRLNSTEISHSLTQCQKTSDTGRCLLTNVNHLTKMCLQIYIKSGSADFSS